MHRLPVTVHTIPCATPRLQAWRSQPLHRRCSTQTRAQPASADKLATLPWQDTPDQLQALYQLQQRLRTSPYGLPDQDTLKWFLRDRKFDVAEAESKLTRMLAWRTQNRISDLTEADIQPEYATGKGFLHEHPDLYGRPVVIIRAARHRIGEFPPQSSQLTCAYVLEQAVRALPPGQENILGVFDLRGFGTQNADILFAKFLIDCLFLYYPKRAGQILMVDAPWIFQPTYSIIKPMLGKYAALVRFVSSQQLATEYFTPETVPRDFLRS